MVKRTPHSGSTLDAARMTQPPSPPRPNEGDATPPNSEEQAENESPATPSLLGKHLGRTALIIGVLTVLVYGGLIFYADSGSILSAMSRLSPGLVITAALLSCGNYLVRFARWHLYLGHLGLRIPLNESLCVFLSGFSMTLTPGKVGEILKSVLLKKSRDIPLSRTAPIVLAERVTDLAGLVILIAIGSLAFSYGKVITVGAIIGVSLIIALSASRRFADMFTRLCSHLPLIRNKTRQLSQAFEALRTLSSARALLVSIPLSIVAWSLQCVGMWYLALGFAEIELSLVASCFAYSFPLLAGTVAMIPGGLGLAEVSMTGVLDQLAVGQGALPVAATITILVRLVTFWLAIGIGIAAVAWWARNYSHRSPPIRR